MSEKQKRTKFSVIQTDLPIQAKWPDLVLEKNWLIGRFRHSSRLKS